MNMDMLDRLVQCHSTPGDEDEVAAALAAAWQGAGWEVSGHGGYGISATVSGNPESDRPRLLVCAHMDSPGFIVQQVRGDDITLIPLGGVRVTDATVDIELKTGTGKFPVVVTFAEEDGADRYRGQAPGTGVIAGDRACFAGRRRVHPEGLIESPFLDNRLGCLVLCELAARLPGLACQFTPVLAATGSEEMGGSGARVLARALAPDVVICVDATYEDTDQGVCLGGGPVLTLTDRSVLLSCRARDRLARTFRDLGIPLQTEVYNVSGTDAAAFPAVGLPCPVYALLVATRGNHSLSEICSADDVTALVEAIVQLYGHDNWVVTSG